MVLWWVFESLRTCGIGDGVGVVRTVNDLLADDGWGVVAKVVNIFELFEITSAVRAFVAIVPLVTLRISRCLVL